MIKQIRRDADPGGSLEGTDVALTTEVGGAILGAAVGYDEPGSVLDVDVDMAVVL